MIQKRFILITVFSCLLFGIFTSCSSLLEESKYESVEILNSVYNDTFTLISRKDVNSNLSYSNYSAKKLKKTVTVLNKVVDRQLTSITTENYSNYIALKYEDEIIQSIRNDLSKLYLSDEDYTVYSDCKCYLSFYADSPDFDNFNYLRKHSKWDSSLPVINEETVYLIIKSSSININKNSYMNAASHVFSKAGFYSSFKVLLVDDSINMVDIINSEAAEKLYKSKKYENCYNFSYDKDFCRYNWSEEK